LSKPKDRKVGERDLTHMDEVLLTGFVELDEEQRGLFCEHVMDPNNWAKKINRKKSAKSKAAKPLYRLRQSPPRNAPSLP
jgi:hypothetical protein